MNLSLLSGEEQLFLSRLDDLFAISRGKYKTKFSSFLNERQALIAEEFAKQNRFDNYLLFGGRKGASRLVLGAFSPGETPQEAAFPISHLTVRYPKSAELSHRDFLGSLMALRISRESIGDLLISPGRCDIFVQNPVTQTILNELAKVGNTGVKCAAGVPGDFVVLERFEAQRGTVSSARLDSLVSMLLNISREKAVELIRRGLVLHNWTQASSASQAFVPEDVLSIRGYGKFIVDEIGAPTRKGRLPVLCRKYI